MAVKTKAREVEAFLPKIVEQRADYQGSIDVARKHNGAIIRLEKLPQLLNDPDFVKSVEGTESYKKNGSVWFWTYIAGNNLNGYYRINPQGKTLDEMFIFISNEFDSKVKAVPLNESTYFLKGNRPLSFCISRSGVGLRRLDINGYKGLGIVAPVVVVDIYANVQRGMEAFERLRRSANMQSQPSSTAL